MKRIKMEKCIWRKSTISQVAEKLLTDVQLTNFLKEFSHISILDLEEILEYLQEYNLLNDEGKEFRDKLWRTYIKE